MLWSTLCPCPCPSGDSVCCGALSVLVHAHGDSVCCGALSVLVHAHLETVYAVEHLVSLSMPIWRQCMLWST